LKNFRILVTLIPNKSAAGFRELPSFDLLWLCWFKLQRGKHPQHWATPRCLPFLLRMLSKSSRYTSRWWLETNFARWSSSTQYERLFCMQ